MYVSIVYSTIYIFLFMYMCTSCQSNVLIIQSLKRHVASTYLMHVVPRQNIDSADEIICMIVNHRRETIGTGCRSSMMITWITRRMISNVVPPHHIMTAGAPPSQIQEVYTIHTYSLVLLP